MGDFQGAVGAVGNLGVVFHRSHGTGFSTAYHMRSVANRDGSIQMLMDRHRLPR